LAGSHAGSAETVQVHFGGSAATYTLNSAESFQNLSLNFTPSRNGWYALSFLNQGGDNAGALLDRVTVWNNNLIGRVPSSAALVSAVPEPEMYAMLLAGGLLMGFIARRRMT
jgi:hypothetical protein